MYLSSPKGVYNLWTDSGVAQENEPYVFSKKITKYICLLEFDQKMTFIWQTL